MIRYFINVAFTPEPELQAEKINDKGSKTVFLAFCMHAAAVHRLFCKEDVAELLYRLAILFQHEKIISRFFTDDSLIAYNDRGAKDVLCLNDIKENLGLELSDYHGNVEEREQWINKIDTYWKNASMMGLFTGKSILDRRVIGLNKFAIGTTKPLPITDAYKDAAALFSNQAILTLGEKAFADLGQRIMERNAFLAEEKARLSIKPKHEYNYDEIPIRVKEIIFESLYCPVYKNKELFESVAYDKTSKLEALIHLAWLMANHYIVTYKVSMNGKHGYDMEVDGKINIDLDRYDGMHSLGLGISLYLTYIEYELERFIPLLKEEE